MRETRVHPEPLAPVPRRLLRRGSDGEPQLGEVVRDAVDHAQVIVRDSVAIGRLEARRFAGRARQTFAAAAPRVGWGALAAVVGGIGIVLLLVAIFLLLGKPVPSVAARLIIFAVAFFVVAALATAAAARVREPATPTPMRPEEMEPPAE